MISKGLRTWFVIHFAIDILFAIPFNILWIYYRLQLREFS
jgi:hypothetical protein